MGRWIEASITNDGYVMIPQIQRKGGDLPLPDNHDCNKMCCGKCHYIFRAPLDVMDRVEELEEQLEQSESEMEHYGRLAEERQKRIEELEARLAEAETPIDDVSCIQHERRKAAKDK